jgi:hypothetical protein
VVRTGGGFVSIEQFLEKYGKLEEMKHLKLLSNKKMIENIRILGRHSPPSQQASYSTQPTGSGAQLNTIDVQPKQEYDTKTPVKPKPFGVEKHIFSTS